MNKSVLIVEDEPMQRQMLATLLRRKLSLGAHEVENGQQALDLLERDQKQMIKLVILDVGMPVMGGLETLEILKQNYPALPVIMLTGSRDVKDAVQAMKLGAIDFLTKPYEADRMAVTVKNALKLSTLSKEVSRLKHEQEGTYRFEDLIGHDGGLLQTVTIGRKAAASDIPVLLLGETGTGKEVFAKAIHGMGTRAGRPFVAVNCGAIPSQLVESTLFGHEKGAFTGATEKTLGKFREADGGTIFLDEVGELPLDAQVKLLRVLQQKEVEPVGGNKPVSVNIRIISATNRNLKKDVEDGRFREDLFFRLNVLHIDLPPLRERKQDIPSLVNHFIDRYCADEGRVPQSPSEEVLEKFMAHHWPGNVRQLENTVHRALVVGEDGLLEINDLQAKPSKAHPSAQSPLATVALTHKDSNFKTLEDIEAEAIRHALSHFEGNVTQAAKALGVSRSTFYKKLKENA